VRPSTAIAPSQGPRGGDFVEAVNLLGFQFRIHG